jgi:hypothetical protein
MKRIHMQHEYQKWAKARILPNTGPALVRAQRFLYHMFKVGEISQDERLGWEKTLAADIDRLGWANPAPVDVEQHQRNRQPLQELIEQAMRFPQT